MTLKCVVREESLKKEETSLQRLCAAIANCVSTAKTKDANRRKKWFGNAYDDTVVQTCVDNLCGWMERTYCYVEFKTTDTGYIASTKYKVEKAKLLGNNIGGFGFSICCGPLWSSPSAVEGDRLLSVIHEITHRVICTLDIVDEDVVSKYPANVRSQIPAPIVNAEVQYYGFDKVTKLAAKSSVAATLNAENWAYFLAEYRDPKLNMRFLSKTDDSARIGKWGSYRPDLRTPINTGAFV